MTDPSVSFPRPMGGVPGNSSPIGRLLEEISWEGNAKPYRQGGRGRENVLTTEVFLALDFLPRSAFMGAVLRAATGADEARSAIIRELESAIVELLPGDIRPVDAAGTSTSWTAQPDVLIEGRQTICLVEAKRIRSATFQVKQVARTLMALEYLAQGRDGLVLLVLPKPPPISVTGHGRLEIVDAAELGLTQLDPDQVERLRVFAQRSIAWVTWEQISSMTMSALSEVKLVDASVAGSVRRIAQSIVSAIDWHK